MTERKRPTLDLSGMGPRPIAPDPIETKALADKATDETWRRQTSTPTPTPTPAPRPAPKPKPVEYVRIAFDVPKELRQALQDGARKHGLGTVRAVILDALKDKGYHVSADELLDKRTRR